MVKFLLALFSTPVQPVPKNRLILATIVKREDRVIAKEWIGR